MKWLNRLSALTCFFIIIGAVREFLSKKEVIVFNKEDFAEEDEEEEMEDIIKLKPENYDHAMDVRGTPTHVCPCGCNIWNLKVIFDNYEVATYFLDMECVNCGSLATAPTPLDKESTEQ